MRLLTDRAARRDHERGARRRHAPAQAPVLLALSAALLIGAGPAGAQDGEEGRSLMQEGAELFLEGLRQEMEPGLEALREHADEMEPALRDFVERMGPAFADLMDEIGDLSAYHPPEKLPNGDIILRRKTQPEEETPLPESEIEI